MSVLLACSQCGRPMQSTGVRGLCPRCLFACTTPRATVAESTGTESANGPDETLGFGLSVGPEGRFLLLDKLGEGGMGEVWLASDQALSQGDEPELVALKFLSREIRHDTKAMATVRTEVLRSQKLSHPNIVRIFDLHTHEGMPFIKMEYVEGNSLKRWLELEPGGVMPWRMAAQLTHQLVSALEYAHQRVGIVHRDLKPGNLLLTQGPVLKLSDFGIAVGLRESDSSLWESGGVGTLLYASPQQLAGERPAPEDDIYALGATLYELLTGSVPLEADNLDELIRKVRYEPPPSIPERLRALGRRNEVPPKMLLLVQRCLEKDPLLRPKTSEVARLLPPVMDPMLLPSRVGVTTEATWVETPARPESKLRPWLWGTAFVLAVAGAAVALWSLRRGASSDAAEPDRPRVVATSLPTDRSSTSEFPAQFSITFWTNLVAGLVNASTNYELRFAGDDGKFGTTDDRLFPVGMAREYITGPVAAYQVSGGPFPPGLYQFIISSNLADLSGAALTTNVVRYFTLAKPAEPAPPPPPPPGELAVTIRGNPKKLPLNCEIFSLDGRLAYKTKPILARPDPEVKFNCELPPGTYTLVVSDSSIPAWVLKETVLIASSQPKAVETGFVWGDLEVTSDPPDVDVQWPKEVINDARTISARTPFTKSFRAGELPFLATKFGFFDLKTNFPFNPQAHSGRGSVRLNLRKTIAPLDQDLWANSLNMAFRRVGPLFACVTETSVGNFRQFAKDSGYDAKGGIYVVTDKGWENKPDASWENPGFPQTDDHPVVGVSWHDAVKFCEWLTQRELKSGHLLPGQRYRLPSTNEWFQLAGGSSYPGGGSLGAPVGNYSGQEVLAAGWPACWPVLSSHQDKFPRTAPVAETEFKNGLGFYHLGGNAAEWCQEQVLCGGSWYDGEDRNLEFLETHTVQVCQPASRHDRNGFRVVITQETK